MRQTKLKPTKRGYVRNLGRLASGSQAKFYLGHERSAALARLSQITTLWQQVEERQRERTVEKPVWDEESLRAARAIEKGESFSVSPHQFSTGFEQAEKYFARINALQQAGARAEPSEAFKYEVGRRDLVGGIENAHDDLSRAIGKPNATGQTLHQALRAYQDSIRKEYEQPDGAITDNANSKIRQTKTLIATLPDCDLGELDYAGCDSKFAVFRKKPISKKYGKPMSRKSCQNYIGEFGRFFRWLHISKDWRWRYPEDFALISRNVVETDDDVEREAEDVPTFTLEQLKIINEYATPKERIFVLLGLNCAYGADQSGRLRIKHLRLDHNVPHIRRVRRKKKILSMHALWAQTKEGLQHFLDTRQESDSPFLLLTENGLAYWRLTKGGNRAQVIPRLWNDLLDRIEKDHPTFPRYAFNTLRDTSANEIRKIAGAEIASIHLAHKHQSKDENLGRYTNPIRRKHFRAIKRLEEKWQAVFEAAPTPWEQPKKVYTSIATIKTIRTLKSQGVKSTEIAKQLGISTATVYRHLEKKEAAPK